MDEVTKEEFEAYLDETGDYPELRMWHVPGSKIGKADFWAYTDGFVVSSGTFDKEFADVAESLASAEDEISISHGYHYPLALKSYDGVYEAYRTFEVTILPAKNASNVWTSIGLESKEVRMLSAAKREFLVTHLGEDRTAKLETGIASLNKELEGAGVAFKDFEEDEESTEESKAADSTKGGEDGDGAGDGAAETNSDGDGTGDEAGASKGDGDGDGEDSKEKGGELTLEAIQGALTKTVDAAIEPIKEQLSALGADVKELQTTDDEKIATKMRPRADVNTSARPSQSKTTEASELPQEIQDILNSDSSGEKGSEDGPPTGDEAAHGYVKDWLMGGGAGEKEEAAAS